MGLDTTHDAFHGAYSAFNRLRQEVCACIGGSYPPHWLRSFNGELARDKKGDVIRDLSLDDERIYFPEGLEDSNTGMFEFLTHSDCDGEISPEMCVKVADALEAILDDMPEEDGGGHIAARGGYKEVLRKFIAGCRAAAAEGVPLEFH